jgi:hypothetical protein
MIENLKLIRDFFPLVLLKGHLKYNFFGLMYWGLLFAIISESFGANFGVPFLFFSPEYLGEVSLWSFLLLGFSLGGFTMGFNVYSYTKLGPRFPFLVVVSTPFFRFCINNALLPLLFIIFYLIKMSKFQLYEEFAPVSTVLIYNIFFILGFFLFILLSILYFFPLRRNRDADDNLPESNPVSSITNKGAGKKWFNYFRENRKRQVYYIGRNFKIYKSRSIAHLDEMIIKQVFSQNRINALIFEIITISAFLSLGFLRNYSLFEVPASMSIITLLTIIAMVFGALSSWFHRWAYPTIFISIIAMSFISKHFDLFRYTSYAIGMDYSKDKLVEYNLQNIREKHKLYGDSTESDLAISTILENWKGKFQEEKPKLVILNTSGGGLRSALWTFTVLSNCDEILDQKLSKHLQMITGASGGMVGAAFFRELILRKDLGQINSKNEQVYKEMLGKDLLNKLSFSASTSDLFMRYKQMEYNGKKYTQERGSEFEKQLHQNLNNYLEHPLGYYERPELNSQVPLMIFSPTIVNDGRRMLMSSQNLSFLIHDNESTSYENIDFQTFFSSNNPQEIRFSSVLRANATFPIIMPMMGMPTVPEIQLMDSGIRDNYGGKVTVDYLFALSEWIKNNTSGVVIIEIRDTKRIMQNEHYKQVSLLDKILLPFGNVYNNFTRTQDLDQEQLMKMCSESFTFPFEKITFNLREDYNDRISLSWHLTKREKQKISLAFGSTENQMALDRLESALKPKIKKETEVSF